MLRLPVNEIAMKTLFDKTVIGTMELKNRFIRSSVEDRTVTGMVTDAMLQTYANLAKGGVGTILTGYTIVDEAEKASNICAIYNDSFISCNKQLTETVHSLGSNILLQLVYLGSRLKAKAAATAEILGASPVKDPHTGVIPKEMTAQDIHRIEQEFAAAALRAQQAGFDGVEIHAAHGFLLHQFASPLQNQRTDQYGGSQENRYRITIETYEAIRNAVGADFPIWIKIQSSDGDIGGVNHEDCLYLCKELAQRKIDAIEISGNFTDYRINTAFFQDIADRVAHEVTVPVIVTGGNRIYEEMEKMINSTKIEYVGMARPLITNPNLINQFAEQHANTIGS